MLKHCEICGQEFVAKRKTARFCSTRCRTRACRGCTSEASPEPVPTVGMSDEEVFSIVVRAYDTAADLSRAALYTSAPLCLSLKRVATKLHDALRKEGL